MSDYSIPQLLMILESLTPYLEESKTRHVGFLELKSMAGKNADELVSILKKENCIIDGTKDGLVPDDEAIRSFVRRIVDYVNSLTPQ